jgi:predicted Fe-Mo cluster-binding NifX family protein
MTKTEIGVTMRIAISADDNQGLDSPIGQHFGRCPYFVLVDVEGQEVKAVAVVGNPYYGNHTPGQVPAFISGQGANVMLAGGMGGRAVEFFRQYGIQPVSGASGTAHDALARFLGGELTGVEACVESQHHHQHHT